MPIYEYVCPECGKLNEVLQKVTDPPPGQCNACGGGGLTKIVSRSTFVLKGGGWYSDLYASAKKDGASKPPAQTSGEPKKDASASASSASAGAPPSGGDSAKTVAPSAQ